MAKQLMTDTYTNFYASHHIPNAPNANEGKECTMNLDKVYHLYAVLVLHYADCIQQLRLSNNLFDHLPSLLKPKPKLLNDELDVYLTADVEDLIDALA